MLTRKSLRLHQILSNYSSRFNIRASKLSFTTWFENVRTRKQFRGHLLRLCRCARKQMFSIAMTKWRRHVNEFNIDEARCLGLDAMRKTKKDIAKRLCARARKYKLMFAIAKWKTETAEDRANEERTHSIQAMANWASRIASCRALNERFQMWVSFLRRCRQLKDL